MVELSNLTSAGLGLDSRIVLGSGISTFQSTYSKVSLHQL